MGVAAMGNLSSAAIQAQIQRELAFSKAAKRNSLPEIPFTVKKLIRYLMIYCPCPLIGRKSTYTFHTKKRREAIDWLKKAGLQVEPLFYTGILLILTRKEYKQLTKIGEYIFAK